MSKKTTEIIGIDESPEGNCTVKGLRYPDGTVEITDIEYKKRREKTIGSMRHFKGTYRVYKTMYPFDFKVTQTKETMFGDMPLELEAEIDEEGQIVSKDTFRVASHPGTSFSL